MKKFKKRIKRALAGLLKDELLDYIGYERNRFDFMNEKVIVERIEFDTLVYNQVIDLNSLSRHHEFEEVLHQAKRKMFEAIEPCIHIETKKILSPEFSYAKEITMILRVQKPKL